MAANFASDISLSAEQECAKRLILLGYQLRSSNPGTDRYTTVQQYGRTKRVQTAPNTFATEPEPLEAFQIVFEYDQRLLHQAWAGAIPLWRAILNYPDGEDLGFTPPVVPIADPAFQLTVLVDSQDFVIVDDSNTYLIEG